MPDVTRTATAVPSARNPRNTPSAADNASTTSTQLAHYRIDAELGAGGMGELYRATNLALERTVALKLPPAHLTSDASTAISSFAKRVRKRKSIIRISDTSTALVSKARNSFLPWSTSTAKPLPNGARGNPYQ